MGDPFDEIRRQQERINELLGPSYRIQEEILRSYAPIRELTESLRSVTDSLVVNGITEDVFRSIAKIGRLDLADFGSVGALTAASRDIAAATEAVRQQSRWIEEVSGLMTLKVPASFRGHTALAAIEKLAASKDVLLDANRWMTPRPFSSAVTDILHAGRSEWALTQLGVPRDEASFVHLARASGAVAEEIAAFRNDSDFSVEPEHARREASAVARVLTEELLLPTLPECRSLDQDDQDEAFRNMDTIADVLRILESHTGRPLFGGHGAWLMGAGLAVVNPVRTAEDRFDAAVKLLYDAFVAGLEHADAALCETAPDFFRQTVRGLRDTSAAHAPEASRPHARIVANLRVRERHLRSLVGRVPATEAEWLEALAVLLSKAASAALEFRDGLG